MKFVKIIINGEEYYRKVEDTAEDITAEDSEPVIEIEWYPVWLVPLLRCYYYPRLYQEIATSLRSSQ